ncbi:MAG: hypothetical protein HY721_01185 [Planctomycetes bacterium]|nr:hypothetical protein [Planctomycetota bacterium]
MPAALATPLLLAALAAGDGKPFAIQVVDDATGRGVPLVELETTGGVRLYTDSNGVAAFFEPGLMGTKVFFHVRSHGYEHAADGFGFRGRALEVVEGGRARLEVRRINIAERLYRVTGAGIYRDSVLAGLPVPTREPVLNAQVVGSDSVINAVYHGRIYWFWGDTNRPSYPLGNFHVPGAVSDLPGKGGLDPDQGIDLRYFTGPDGFARPTAQLPGDGPTWLSGLVVLSDASGKERMLAHYVKVRGDPGGSFSTYERGLAEFRDSKESFEKVAAFPEEEPFPHGAHPVLHETGGRRYVYYCEPYPLVRAPADPDALARQEDYEAFTPLVEGTRVEEGKLDAGPDGRPRYAWKRRTGVVRPHDEARLAREGKLSPSDALLALRDAETGKPVLAHRGSVAWNAHRRRWAMVFCESMGTSVLGEVWYAEADGLLGPWVYSRKVITHERYSFYNPKHHPMLDEDGGRRIYLEGTYTTSFSGNPEKTPRYDYNQVLYRLDLSDPRLNLPVAVYESSKGGDGAPDTFRTGAGARASGTRIAFWALERPGEGTVPVGEAGVGVGAPGAPIFHVLPAGAKSPPAASVALHELRGPGGRKAYLTAEDGRRFPGFERAAAPVGLVWRHPARPVPPGSD